MTRRGLMGLLACGFAGVALGGCALFGTTDSYRFRMVVEVYTPQGLRTGSSVYEVTAWYEPGMDPSGKVRKWTVKGEAVAVDLPGGETLFALLKTTNPMREDLAQLSMAALDPAFNNDIVESAGRIADGGNIRSPAEVAPSDYPMFVTFGNIADPKSVERADSAQLDATFEPGVRLKRIKVEVTNDAVTSGLEKRLVWLPAQRGSLRMDALNSPPPPGIPLPFGANLTESDFTQELR